jgi:hypothetical protein
MRSATISVAAILVGLVADSGEPVTGKCEGWDLAPSGPAVFTIKQPSPDELQITRKLDEFFITEDFGTFVRCPKVG